MKVSCTILQRKCHQNCFEDVRGEGGAASRSGEGVRKNTEVDGNEEMVHGDEGRDRNRQGGGMCYGEVRQGKSVGNRIGAKPDT